MKFISGREVFARYTGDDIKWFLKRYARKCVWPFFPAPKLAHSPAGSPYEDFVACYITDGRSSMKPLTRVVRDGKVLIETTDVGLRCLRPREARGRKTAVIWGDSVVSGGYDGGTWVELLNAAQDKFWFFNGGIPGDYTKKILDRAVEFQKRRRLRVDLNVVVVGWHPSNEKGSNNADIERDLLASLPLLKNVALATTPSAVVSDLAKADLEAMAQLGSDERFVLPFQREYLPGWVATCAERAEIVRKVASVLGLPFFDWQKAMSAHSVEDAQRDFFDCFHPRKCVSPRIAQLWADWLDCAELSA
jgi:hypothetical protein